MQHLLGQAEIGALLGVSRQRVYQLTCQDDFPAPEVTLAMGSVWRTEDVRRWARAHGRTLPGDEPSP
ncbi:helix-turn-helix transcriptional regulator [Saccharopolyspora pogona]|uniref:helix-turn-helix transcriptional regulator n=1 Tax=Saccharopolyspora pogona TaxID=333966 RepID=UPI001688FBBF|nr:DNA-binding protein [Saccharopolyspora pogona]